MTTSYRYGAFFFLLHEREHRCGRIRGGLTKFCTPYGIRFVSCGPLELWVPRQIYLVNQLVLFLCGKIVLQLLLHGRFHGYSGISNRTRLGCVWTARVASRGRLRGTRSEWRKETSRPRSTSTRTAFASRHRRVPQVRHKSRVTPHRECLVETCGPQEPVRNRSSPLVCTQA